MVGCCSYFLMDSSKCVSPVRQQPVNTQSEGSRRSTPTTNILQWLHGEIQKRPTPPNSKDFIKGHQTSHLASSDTSCLLVPTSDTTITTPRKMRIRSLCNVRVVIELNEPFRMKSASFYLGLFSDEYSHSTAMRTTGPNERQKTLQRAIAGSLIG
jgi:hypothetical protein